MGAEQSHQPTTGEHPPAKTMDDNTTALAVKSVDPNNKEASLSGMPLVHYKCRKRKKVYDRCVDRWYTREFLQAKSVDQDEACGELFENYRTCMLKGIKKEIWDKQGLPPPKEGSPLYEVAEEE